MESVFMPFLLFGKQCFCDIRHATSEKGGFLIVREREGEREGGSVICGSLSTRYGASSGCGSRNGLQYGEELRMY